jgi:inner membrane protein
MASFGHVAVGLLASRMQGGKDGPSRRHCSPGVMLAFTALAMLPDADMILVGLGVADHGTVGHRGASHSLTLAVIAGLICAVAARRFRWPVLRTALVGGFAVASHALLDALDKGGRGLPLFWPISNARFHSPWQIFPDSPKGMEVLTRPGVMELALELLLFLPIAIYALWPRITDWRARERLRLQAPPQLTILDGGIAAGALDAAAAPVAPTTEQTGPISEPISEPTLAPSGLDLMVLTEPARPVNDSERDPSIRSSG